MKKADFIKIVAQKAGIPKKEATLAVDAIIAVISDALKDGDAVVIPHFGTFKVSKRPAHKGRDPQTGRETQIPASKLPVFKSSTSFKEFINGKHARAICKDFVNEKHTRATFKAAVDDQDADDQNPQPDRWFAPIAE